MTIRRHEHQLEREPFVPIRSRLDEGITIDVRPAGIVSTMPNSLPGFKPGPGSRHRASGCDMLSLRYFARIEQICENGHDDH